MAAELNKFLTFTIEEENYGLPILRVKEIIGMMNITYVPKMPEFIKGVINLRGKIIPIMDLRLKFGIKERTYDDRTCIIVVELESSSGTRSTGLVVDTVSEVLAINKEDVEVPPISLGETDQEYITGIGKVKDKVVMLIEPQIMLSKDEKEMLQKV
ncbi:purine-binding chemotaxis protein CheW [Clostridium sp. PL3]|uniref:Chemotaxis protein CheW n=1 Tax=Clostridium thailandense TaxID=2794346 RepID=A0A949WTR2_9CLOT|nr:chemotaxis protein CheW [Clostridium thailandense]MBV7276620.1 purine-binding chemotaxis protein CheW [Clostridium thailandense]